MNVQQQQPKERVFDERGETVEEVEAEAPEQQVEDVDPDENQDPDPKRVSEAAPQHKYRIGDKTFATQAEALQYAESQVQTASEVDALRQVVREAVSNVPRTENVTQQEEEDPNEIFTNPKEYLRKRDERIKNEVLQTFNRSQAQADADNRVWTEFRERHPDLSDFREEITGLAARIQPEVQAVAKTKGQVAAYDYVATKYKAQVERQAQALRPKRALPNSSTGAAAGGRVESVTPKQTQKKPSTMTEQIRMMRKGRI
jgi:hypothetical protein